ncbi:MAG: amidohydrolase [Myxococcota bacterium]
MAEPPTLFHNATVHTVDDLRPRADWFTVLGDRFQLVGSGPPPKLQRSVDLGGRTVVPGFVDAHAHFFQTGIDRLFVDLSGADTVAEIGRRIGAVGGGPRTWIFGHSYEEDTLTDVPRLTRDHLDEMFPKRPVWINRVDYHSAVVNSVALRRLELPKGIRGMVADADGRPTGILRSEAYMHAKQRVSRLYPIETKEKAARTAAEACIRSGITAVHALEGGKIFGDEGVSTLLKKMHSLPLSITVFLQEMNVHFTSRLGFEHLGGCILIDGSIGSYTAALEHGYASNPKVRGVLYEKARDLEQFVEEGHVAGIQLAFHAIGPRAIDMVLNAYERALKKYPRYDHRHRIEHFELATDRQIARARDLGVVPSMQPSFEYFWGGPDGMYASRLGDGWQFTNRLRTILDHGVRIPGGSDTNVTPPDPLLGMHAAVNMPNPEQRVSVGEALRMMTLDAAWAAFDERQRGSISVGKEASFVVLDADPFEASGRIKNIAVEETWYRGRRVHAATRDGGRG